MSLGMSRAAGKSELFAERMKATFSGNGHFKAFRWVTTSYSPQSGHQAVTMAAKKPHIAKMAENCINCMSARPTQATQTLRIRVMRTLFRLKINKNQKVRDF